MNAKPSKPTLLLSAQQVHDTLAPLTLRQLDRLGALSGVPVPTIYKIKLGVTTNPGIETVRRFWPFIERAQQHEGAVG
jgi:hypothetical protein